MANNNDEILRATPQSNTTSPKDIQKNVEEKPDLISQILDQQTDNITVESTSKDSVSQSKQLDQSQSQTQKSEIEQPTQQKINNFELFSDRPISGRGLNPIVYSASRILNVVVPLKTISIISDLDLLRKQLITAIRKFESELNLRKIDHDTIAAARYVICTLLDETISNSTWGGSGAWATKSLLVYFHKETWGGEKVFAILQQLSLDPRKNIDLLELYYICLAFGLQGRYRVRDSGLDQLENLKGLLQQMIYNQRGSSVNLSPFWEGISKKNQVDHHSIPLWVIASFLIVILMLIHLYLYTNLDKKRIPISKEIDKISLFRPVIKKKETSTPTTIPVVIPQTFIDWIEEDIKEGRITINQSSNPPSINVATEKLFSSASAEINSSFFPFLERLGEALNYFPGNVTVIGHTDNIPILFRYPSNQELSLARAQSVVKYLLKNTGPKDRFTIEGHGDREPIASNKTPHGRSRNRRVELIFFPSDIKAIGTDNAIVDTNPIQGNIK